ncbi:MAG: putative DNA-binding protein [Bacillota bacterium]|nr:putative DNA-binding protein [Bacillota bacterium]
MENVYEITLLMDFYGQLLTARQYEIMDLHYNDDLSLAEIAEQLNISRQGVFDNIKRGKAALDEFEAKLGLVKKFIKQKTRAEDLLNKLSSLNRNEISQDNGKIINDVENGLKDMIDLF